MDMVTSKSVSWRTTSKSFAIFLLLGALLVIVFQWNYVQNVFPGKSGSNPTPEVLRAKVKNRKDIRVNQAKLQRNLKLVLAQRAKTTIPGSMDIADKKKAQICGKKWQEEYKKLHQDILESKSPPKYLVFQCGGVGYGCGGYGNRINGITSLLYLAVLTKRALLIDWKSNISITDYLIPKNIKWNYSISNLRGLQSRRHYWGRGIHRNVPMDSIRPGYRFDEFLKWYQSTDLVAYFNHQVEFVSTQWYFAPSLRKNKYVASTALEIAPKLRGHRYSLIGCAFDFLFQKTTRFKKLLNIARKSLKWKSGVPRIGIHFRAGDYTAFQGRRNTKKEVFSALERFFHCASKLESRIKKADPSLDTSLITWFLATDTKKAKNYGKKHYPNKVTYLDVKIEHISLSDPSRLGIEGVLLDNALLSECDVLIMSNSSFSRNALGMSFHSLILNAFGDNCKY